MLFGLEKLKLADKKITFVGKHFLCAAFENLTVEEKLISTSLAQFLTLFQLRYLGPLYHFGMEGGVGGGKITPLVFSRSTYPIRFKLGKYLNQHKYFQNK